MDPTSPEFLYSQKEGAPLNTPTPISLSIPTCVWNATEDPDLPMDPDNSVASRVCDVFLAEDCKDCSLGRIEFLMASTSDFALKQFTQDTYERDVYTPSLDRTYAPTDASNFPNVLAGAWRQDGYSTIIQQAEHREGGLLKKTVNRIAVEMSAVEQDPPGKLFIQLGTANTPGGMRWDSSAPQNIDAKPDSQESPGEVSDLRPARPASYAFFRDGIWLSHRAYVASSGGSPAPKDCAVSLSSLSVSLKDKNTDWSKA